MPTIIQKRASAIDILSTLRLTHANASERGAPFAADAERYLGKSIARATAIATRVAQTSALLTPLRAKRDLIDQAANVLVSNWKDELFQAIGRRRSDPIFEMLFPDGAATYIATGTVEKPEMLELLAQSLETLEHPRIPPAMVADAVGQLRATAAALTAANTPIGPHAAVHRLLTRQFTMNARSGQHQLVLLKKYWVAAGLTETEVHEIIPSAGPSRPAKRAAPPTAEEIAATLDPVAGAPAA